MDLSGNTRLSIEQDIAKLSRPKYEDLLVQLELASLHSLREGHYAELQKRELIFETVSEINRRNQLLTLLQALKSRHILSYKTLVALDKDGIEFQPAGQKNEPPPEEAPIHLQSLAVDHRTVTSDTPVPFNVFSILFLAADPTDASRLRLGEEFREIQEQLRSVKLREQVRLELPQLSVRPADISQALLDVQPQIVHFSGHGAASGALFFENQTGQAHIVQPAALAALFEQFAHHVTCVLLNACYSEAQAWAIGEHIEYVIGMNQAISDEAAIAFAIGFYQALGAGRTIEDAFNLGCVQIQLHGVRENLTPVLFKKSMVQQ
jgi:hypothetical protein